MVAPPDLVTDDGHAMASLPPDESGAAPFAPEPAFRDQRLARPLGARNLPDRSSLAHGFRVQAHDLPRSNAAADFPQANALAPVSSFAAGSRTPACKSVVVTLRPAVATA